MYKFHDFSCTDCNDKERLACWTDKLQEQKCSTCGGDLVLEVERAKGTSATYIPFKEGWYEHFAKDPIYIKNKQELKDACKKHNMGSVYRDDM